MEIFVFLWWDGASDSHPEVKGTFQTLSEATSKIHLFLSYVYGIPEEEVEDRKSKMNDINKIIQNCNANVLANNLNDELQPLFIDPVFEGITLNKLSLGEVYY